MFTLKAPAKVNLCLKVTGKREDGYHNLFNVMCFLDICDSVKIKENKSVFPSLYMSGKYGHMFDNFHSASIEGNTIMKALDFMHYHYRTPMNFDITVNKEIPVGGGLGGSATNAGLIVSFLADYFGIEMSPEVRSLIGPEIGYDVPFFTQSNTAICLGGGEIIKPIEMEAESQPIPALIVYPNFQINSSEVYQNLEIENFLDAEAEQQWQSFLTTPGITFKSLVSETTKLGNDLTTSAAAIRKEIGVLTKELQKCNGTINAGMSGSGSCCFAAFENQDDLQAAVVDISNKFPSCEVIPSRLLPSFSFQQVVMSSRPAMEMIFHPAGEEDQWEKIR